MDIPLEVLQMISEAAPPGSNRQHKDMKKKGSLVMSTPILDGIRKQAMSTALQAALVVGGISAAGVGGVYLGMSKKDKKQMGRELRDPRLYSNVSGMLQLKSREDRKAAHKNLGKGDGTIFGAIRSNSK